MTDFPRVNAQVVARKNRRDFVLMVEDRRSKFIGGPLLDALEAAAMPAIRLTDPRPAGWLRHLTTVFIIATSLLDRSDHSPFWDRGIPAVMLIAGTPDRSPHYHRETDATETLDYPRLAKIVDAVTATLGRLASTRSTSDVPGRA